jgi:hypothetical protein
MTTPSPKPKRRWFQFSLRTLLLFVLLSGLLLGLAGAKVREWIERRRAERRIEAYFEACRRRAEETRENGLQNDWGFREHETTSTSGSSSSP